MRPVVLTFVGHLALASLLARPAAAELPAIELPGKLDTVTVYRGQAMVTRLVDVPAEPGLREVIVTGLPAQMLPSSVFAEGAEGLVVRSVRYRERPVEQDIREEVRALDEKIRGVQDEIETNAKQRELLTEQRAYLQKLEQFTAPTATAELTHGVLNAETLKTLSEYLLDGRKLLVDRELELNRQQRELTGQLSLHERQRQVLTGDSARRLREAVIFVDVQGEQGGRLRLGYLVSQASWTPSYNLRAVADAQHVTVEYNASIQQMSGEDWSDVSMTLSTATPSLVAKAPALTPLTITLTRARPEGQVQAPAPSASEPLQYAAAKAELEARKRNLEQQRQQLSSRSPSVNGNLPALHDSHQQGATVDQDLALNTLAADIQVLDLLVRSDVAGLPKSRGGQMEEVSVTYALPMRTSLPSRTDQQLVQIAALEMPAEFYKVAVPKLTRHVYDEATATNASDLVLLAGPVSTYRDGQFVGLGEIPTVASGETFGVGLGIDASLRTKSELAAKGESLQGGNRVVDFTYRVEIENFGGRPATVRLFERMPQAKDGDVKLTLVKPGADLSADPAYLQTERKKGLLRWDIEVPARTIGVEALGIEYQFRMEYDKQLSIAGLPAAEAAR